MSKNLVKCSFPSRFRVFGALFKGPVRGVFGNTERMLQNAANMQPELPGVKQVISVACCRQLVLEALLNFKDYGPEGGRGVYPANERNSPSRESIRVPYWLKNQDF